MFNPRLRTALPKSFALRQARAARPVRSVRWQSTQSASVSGGSSGAAVGAASGAAAALVVCYGLYQYSGLSRVAQVSKQANQAYEQTKQKVQEAVPEPDEAIQWLRRTANSYAWFIPGAKQYIDVAFDDLETIRQQHGPEVDQIVKDTYNELKEATQGSSFNTETAAKVVSILQSKVEEIGRLAGDAAEKILDNHPDIKNKVGGSLDQLKQLGNSLGPEAKEEVDKTWDQIRELLSAGISVGTADKLRKIVQEKVEKLRRMGDQAWQKGMEQAKPYLDKSPKVKEIVEQNADQLKSGNIMQLWDKVKDAASSGNTADLESFVKQTVDKAKQQNLGGLEKYLDMIPGGSQILPQLSQLSQIAQKNGKEAEDLLRKTVEDIKQILSKRSEEAKRIADKAKNEAS